MNANKDRFGMSPRRATPFSAVHVPVFHRNFIPRFSHLVRPCTSNELMIRTLPSESLVGRSVSLSPIAERRLIKDFPVSRPVSWKLAAASWCEQYRFHWEHRHRTRMEEKERKRLWGLRKKNWQFFVSGKPEACASWAQGFQNSSLSAER